jgi:hypothetical protein
MKKYLNLLPIITLSLFYVLSGVDSFKSDIYGEAYVFIEDENLIYSMDSGSVKWIVTAARVTVAATRQAVAVTRVYTPEVGNLARAARISLAIAYNFNEHIKLNFPEETLQIKYRMWELDNI